MTTTSCALQPCPTEPGDPRLIELLGLLSLEEKVQLLTGRDFWSTHGNSRIGLHPIVFSDGPAGIRGQVWDERDPSVSLPSGSALAASWDHGIAHRYGEALAGEAGRKGVDVVLGPTINMHRTPGGGRHFECFSEDPVLTGDLAAAYVRGIQSHGIAATPKHYLCNDFETDRYTVDVVVDERTLREVYLRAFEKAVTEAHAWLVMSSYNAVNGATASENDLLETPLNSEWGFDGVLIGDWTGVRSIESARHSQDLAMPGPDGPWGGALVAAVRDGSVEEAAVDRKVLRLLLLAARLGRLDGTAPAAQRDAKVDADVDVEAFARTAATEAAVLLENRAVLPVDPATVRRITVVGHGARYPRIQGGGSATVVPSRITSPLSGIRAAFPDADVQFCHGPLVEDGITFLPLDQLTNPATGRPGLQVRFLDRDGTELHREDRRSTNLVWFGGTAPVRSAACVEIITRYRPETAEQLRLGVGAIGRVEVLANGVPVLDRQVAPVGTDLGAALLASPITEAQVPTGPEIELMVRIHPPTNRVGLQDALGVRFGLLPPTVDDDELIAAAAAAAAESDLVVVVVGTNAAMEAEGDDRTDLTLPGRQDDLVRALAAANPRTVVVVNAGAPVLLPWADRVGAVLQMWFPGQAAGQALADVLTGAAEPGGRLPTTWPARHEDIPILAIEPVGGQVRYDEGVHVGYRNWLRLGRRPAYPFGHGEGYTSWQIGAVGVPAHTQRDATVAVTVELTNSGVREGKQVVQVYAARPDSAIERPQLWLAGFSPARVPAGVTARVEVEVPARTFAHWDAATHGWAHEPGDFELRIGFSSADLPVAASIRVD
jgi:beta-glucosidase